MLTVDEFESAFRSADKERFVLAPPEVTSVLVVTDLEGAAHDEYVANTRRYLDVLADGVSWASLGGDGYDDVDGLLRAVDEIEPDLVVGYRNLKTDAWRWPYSLGVFLNVLLRETTYPVLVLPNPHELPDLDWWEGSTKRVMVMADHLAGDATLVNWGVKLAAEGGTLVLSHIEDDVVFERYLSVIGKVPTIDTDVAREEILKQLLKEPHDYILSTRSVLEEAKLAIDVEEIVITGHRVNDYLRLVEENAIDVLAFHTGLDDQIAMHGASYVLSVQLRDKPILMI